MRRGLHLPVLMGSLALLALTVACESDSDERVELQYTCERDLELLNSELTCSTTGGCPCGSRCEFGVCTYDCAADSDCGSQSCSVFGRCEGNSAALSTERDSRAQRDNFLRVAPNDLEFVGAESENSFVVRMGNVSAELEVRVRTSDNRFAVACGGASFTRSCSIRLTTEEPNQVVRVQRVGAPRTADDPEAAVFVSSRQATRTVTMLELSDPTGDPRIRAGRYNGSASLLRIEQGDVTKSFEASRRLTVPFNLHVEVGGEQGVVQMAGIDDPFDLFGGVRDSETRWGLANTVETTDAFTGTRDYLIVDETDEESLRPFALRANQTLSFLRTPDNANYIQGTVRLEIAFGDSVDPMVMVFSLQGIWEDSETMPLRLDAAEVSPTGTPQELEPWPGERFANEFFDVSNIDSRASGQDRFARAINMACGSLDGTPTDPAATFDPNGIFETTINALETGDEIQVPAYDGDPGCLDGAGGEPYQMPIFLLYQFRGDNDDIQLGIDPEEFDTLLTACLDETSVEGFRSEAICMDMARWFAAAQIALSGVDGTTQEDLNAQRFGSYLVSRVLDLNTFMGDTFGLQRAVRRYFKLQGSDLQPLDEVVGFPGPAEYVRRLSLRWDVLLHPTILQRLTRLSSEVLNEPDYRPSVLSGGAVNTGAVLGLQAVPVTVSILSDVVGQARSWIELSKELYYGRTVAEIVPRNREIVAEASRRALILSAIAITLGERTMADIPEDQLGSWAKEFNTLQPMVISAFATLADDLLTEWAPPETMPLPYNQVGDQSSTGSRFRAMSEMMLGDGTSLGGVVGAELDQATAIFESALARYRSYRREAIQLESMNDTAEDRRDYVAKSAGGSIVQLCGYKNDDVNGFTVFENEPDPYTCFIDDECAGRSYQPPDAATRMFHVCNTARVLKFATTEQRDALRDSLQSTRRCLEDYMPDSASDADIADALSRQTEDPEGAPIVLLNSAFSKTEVQLVSAFGNAPCQTTLQDVDTVRALFQLGGELSPATFNDAEAFCRDVYVRRQNLGGPAECQAGISDIADQVNGDLAGSPEDDERFFDASPSASCNYSIAEISDFDSVPTQCMVGELGVEFAKVRTAEARIAEAEAAVQLVLDRLKVETDGCNIQAQASARLKDLYDRFTDSLESLRGDVTAAKNKAAIGKGVQKCGSALAGVDNIAGAAVAGVGCALAAGTAFLETQINDRENEIADLSDQLSNDLADIQADADVALCFNALGLVTADLGPALAKVKVALANHDTAYAGFQKKQGFVTQFYLEGTRWIAGIDSRTIQVVPQGYQFREFLYELDWFVRRIQDRLVQAIRAVEWELQQSLVDPREVMTTYDVEDLRVLANELRNAVLQGRVAGGNPTQGIFTLSLTELLDVRDPEDQPPNFHRLSRDEQLRMVLQDARYAVYDAEGNWIGQGIPFSLSPQGFELEASTSTSVLTSRLCGEKVWGVGAVAVGNSLAPLEGSRLFRMFLKKRNSFYARACTAEAEPLVGYVSLDDDINADSDDTFTSAWVNARVYRSDSPAAARAALEKGTLVPSITNSLAGLGLYGDYELFLPASTLTLSEFDLNALKDILLTFDVVAVTNNAQF